MICTLSICNAADPQVAAIDFRRMQVVPSAIICHMLDGGQRGTEGMNLKNKSCGLCTETGVVLRDSRCLCNALHVGVEAGGNRFHQVSRNMIQTTGI